MSSSDDADPQLPVSWDEAREVVIVVLVAAAGVIFLSPLLGYLDSRFPGSWADDLAELTRNAAPTAGVLLLAAAVLVVTTPPADLVPVLRRTVAIASLVVLAAAIVAITIELTRPSAAGVAGRLQSVLGRSGPGAMLAGTARWLTLRVVPFDD